MSAATNLQQRITTADVMPEVEPLELDEVEQRCIDEPSLARPAAILRPRPRAAMLPSGPRPVVALLITASS